MFERLHELWFRIHARFQRDELDAELQEELKAHAQFLEEEAVRNGASPDDARRVAAYQLGNMSNIRETTRERWSFGSFENVLQDTKYAFRFLRRSPGFTAVAVLSLALGIGANATVFTVADKLLFSAPAHVVDAGALYKFNVKRTYADKQDRPFHEVLWIPEYLAVAERATAFSEMAMYMPPTKRRLGRGPSVPRIKESLVTGTYFEMLGTRPLMGRFLNVDDDVESGAMRPAVISYTFWKRQFGGADSVIGMKFSASDLPFVIVGVAPRDFGGTELDAADTWVPFHATVGERLGPKWREWAGNQPRLLVRLKAGISAETASAQATSILNGLPESPKSGPSTETVSLGSVIQARGPSERTDAVKVSERLVIASTLVLLAACANLANLLLVRALTRRREIALRLAVGVSRARLISQMLIESMIIAVAGAVAAMVAAHWAGDALRTLVFPDIQWASGTLEWRVFLFAAATGMIVAAIATIAPAIRMTRPDIASTLRSAAPQLSASAGRLRQVLLATQVALSVLLVVGATVFSQSLQQAYAFDMGVDVNRLITMRLTFESDSLNPTVRQSTFEEAARRARRISGVERATVAGSIPLTGATFTALAIPERELPPRSFAMRWDITPDLQQTMGVRLVRGRWIEPEDVAPGMIAPILISETGAGKLWPGMDPIGRCARLGTDSLVCHQVVGVIRDLRQRSVREDAIVSMLVGTANADFSDPLSSYLVIRTHPNADVERIVAATRQAMLTLRSDIASIEVQPISKALDPDFRPLRLGTATFGSFAVLAIFLAAVGLYGILAFSVTQRTNEFGIRSALGARGSHIIASVVRDGAVVVAAGLGVGVVMSWYASTTISALLFQADAHAGSPYIVAAIALGVVTLAASAIPAWRATRIDPATALRAE